MKAKVLTLVLAMTTALVSSAQTMQGDAWTLKRCIEYARENNIQVQMATVSKENSDQDLIQAKAQSLPTLSASVGQNGTFSRSQLDDNNFKGSYSASTGLSSSVTLYNGGRLKNNYEIQKIYNDGYAYDILDAQNDIEISVTQAYLNILYARETVKTAENTLEASAIQKDRAWEMYQAGSISQSEYAQFESQYSSDNYNLVNSKSSLSRYILTLKQLLELGVDEEFTVEFPELEDDKVLAEVPSVYEVYNTAVEVMPDMEGSRLDIQAAKLNEKIAKASALPTISANASLGTNYVSGGSKLFDQMNNRLNSSVGISLSIPIANGKSAKTSKAKAVNNTRQAELSYQNAQKSLLSTIESLHQDAVSAQSRYLAAKTKLESAELSYRLVSEKFSEGMLNAVELLTEKNTYTAAQQELNQSKYQAILSNALLNFYMETPIEL